MAESSVDCVEDEDGRGPVGRCMRPIEACCSDEKSTECLSHEVWAEYIEALLEAMDEIQDEEFAWAVRQKQCLVPAGLARIYSTAKNQELRGKALEALVIVCGVVPEGYLKIWSDGFAGSIAAHISKAPDSSGNDAECHQSVDQHTPYALAALVELCCWAENEPPFSSSSSPSKLKQLVNTDVVSGAVELLGSGVASPPLSDAFDTRFPVLTSAVPLPGGGAGAGATLVIAHLASLSLALTSKSDHTSPTRSPKEADERRASGLEGGKQGVCSSASDEGFLDGVRQWVGASGFLAVIHQHRFGLYVGENAVQLLNRTDDSSSQRALLRLVLALLSEGQEEAGRGSEEQAMGAAHRSRRSLLYDGDVLVLAEIAIRIAADSGKDQEVQCLSVVAIGAIARQLDLRSNASLRAEMRELLSSLMDSHESHGGVRTAAERVLMDGIHLFDP